MKIYMCRTGSYRYYIEDTIAHRLRILMPDTIYTYLDFHRTKIGAQHSAKERGTCTGGFRRCTFGAELERAP
jgi:hypothetical protein